MLELSNQNPLDEAKLHQAGGAWEKQESKFAVLQVDRSHTFFFGSDV
jgi:hypothetical protein